VLSSIDAIEFDEAWSRRHTVHIEGLDVAVLSREHLIRNKKAGWPQDIADAARLEEGDR
jgi:hypothetical protein